MSPTKLLVTLLQVSDAVTEPMSTAGIFPKHCTVAGAGHVMDGALLSCTVTVLEQVLWTEQPDLVVFRVTVKLVLQLVAAITEIELPLAAPEIVPPPVIVQA